MSNSALVNYIFLAFFLKFCNKYKVFVDFLLETKSKISLAKSSIFILSGESFTRGFQLKVETLFDYITLSVER